MLKQFERQITKFRLFKKGNAVVVAVSGGVDSMTLLNLLSQLAKTWHIKIAVAHVNHKLRRVASDADEKLVQRAASKLGLPFFSTSWENPPRGNVQDNARRFRYDFLGKVAAKTGASLIATAHNRDDQAETLLLHLVRGSGIKGLSAIPWQTKNGDFTIVRPLLNFSRAEIATYAKRQKITFADDLSNKKTDYSRNFVRHKILPLLEKLNPRAREALADTASAMRDYVVAFDEVTKAFADEFFRTTRGKIIWDRISFMSLPTALRRHALIHAYERIKGSRTNLNSDQISHMEAIAGGTNPKGAYMLPGGSLFQRTKDMLFIHKCQGNSLRVNCNK